MGMNQKNMFGVCAASMVVLCSVALAGCSKEDEPVPENQLPTITLSKADLSVEEGKSTTVSFTVVDPDGDTKDSSVLIKSKPTYGDVKVNYDAPSGKGTVEYSAYWIQEGGNVNDGFTLTVKDASGGKAEVSASVSVTDISSPVTIKMTPPTGAYGYQNTQKDNLLNFWFNENQDLVLTFALTDKDADVLSIDYSVTEGVVYNNQVQIVSDGGSLVTATIPVPKIDVPSAEFTFTLKVDDGDEISVAEAHVTIVNKVDLRWTSTTPILKESAGGKATFATTEKASYPGDYKVEVTLNDGSKIPFELPYTFDPVARVLEFGAIPSPGIIGDKSIRATITLTNQLAHAGGESYEETATLTSVMTLLDDRDDDFKLVLNDFNALVDKVEQTLVREDERRLAAVFGTYLLSSGLSLKPDVDSMTKAVTDAFNLERDDLNAKADEIRVKVEVGDTEGARALIDKYTVKVASLGEASIEVLNSSLKSLESNFPSGGSLLLPKPNVNGSTKELAGVGALSRYVGDVRYGVFLDANKTRWEFSRSYAYMGVVDYSTGDVCFL